MMTLDQTKHFIQQRQLLQDYEHLDLMVQIATSGFKAEWSERLPRTRSCPSNHRSADCHGAGVRAKILEGEAVGTYLVVDEKLLERWHVTISPFGAVPKSDARNMHAIRLIHDLAFPLDDCVNSHTIQSSLPYVPYQPFSSLAERIEHLAAVHPGVRILILKGDVQGAFRHLRQHAPDVHRMGGRLGHSQAGVIDLSAPFGWTGSPALYSVFGRAISTIVGRESPASMWPGHPDATPFFAYEWVDDHVMMESDLGERCAVAEDTLRLAMLAVLGPTAINESKFTTWSTKARVLSLDWDSGARTVSMPPDKVKKAITRVNRAAAAARICTVDLQRLLGNLRHVATCLRAARPFYQRLSMLCAAAPRHGCTTISSWAAEDLRWFGSILRSGGLCQVPTRLFGTLPQPDVHVYMDASGNGLCLLDPNWQRYVVLLSTTANSPTRPHAPEWPHIRCWSDNQTTVSRPNKLSARHPLAQELNRSTGFAEATWRLRVSTGHLPGSWNYVADAGSRLHLPVYRQVFTNCVNMWSQVPVPQHIRRIYTTFSSSFRPHHWPLAQDGSTTGHGDSGARGVDSAVNRASSPAIQTISLSSSCSSPSRAGEESRPPSSIPRRPCCPNVAISLGIIKLSAAPQRREPVTVAHFRKIRAGLNFSSPRDRVIWGGGAAVLGYFFLMRRSEYLGIDGSATSQSPTSMDAPQTSRASAATSQSPFEGVKQTK
ncbi:hypothetical protein L914_02952 [Phytophthora nicotianae]|uniref:Reverse transcriptase domain-containing protein n=1 Tax=Phytophthora nicotianae TaxID=4792 RepID=W2NYD5_PHYNI|nr:hypothetical protein L914_02952 [Phytophthora nicotianae]